ncbi:hypothetical protein J6590_006543 [Homalodisca vitripennis]|nr:hypothetical protein J6590_006543 [Homalodisca vitripennis]
MFLGGTYRRLVTEVHKAKYGNRLSRSTPHYFSSVFAYSASRSHRSCYNFSTIHVMNQSFCFELLRRRLFYISSDEHDSRFQESVLRQSPIPNAEEWYRKRREMLQIQNPRLEIGGQSARVLRTVDQWHHVLLPSCLHLSRSVSIVPRMFNTIIKLSVATLLPTAHLLLLVSWSRP